MSKETGGAAFPDDSSMYGKEGMTLRDYFAAKAMQGLLVGNLKLTYNEVAERAYIMAGAMLKERDK